MNPVGSFTEAVSIRSTKSSASASGATSPMPVSEAGADGERSREFAEFLEPAPSQPVPTGAVGDQAAPAGAKPAEGWSIKSLASLMSFLDEPPSADPTLDPDAEDLPDDAVTDVPTDDATVAVATTVVEPLAIPVNSPLQPTRDNPNRANTETAATEAELHRTEAGAHDRTRALGTTGVPSPTVQSAAQSASLSTTSTNQPRRTTATDHGSERISNASGSDDSSVDAEGTEGDASAPLDRATTAARQRDSASNDARPQAKLPNDDAFAPKADSTPAPRNEAVSSEKSSYSASDAADHEDAFKSSNVKSVSQETFMLPSHRAEPARQIGAAVVAEVAQTPAAQPAEPKDSSDPVVKVLNLHLEPRELGAVHIRMHLSHGAMTLSVNVETEELASRLQRDSDILTKMLQSSGITLDGVVVQSLGVERSAFAGNDPSMSQKNQDTQSNQANSNSSGTNEGSARGDESGQGGRRQGEGIDRYEPASPAPGRAAAARASGAIYI